MTSLSLLPVEIIRDILEIAARSDKPTAIILDRVNHTIHQWIGPILYQIVALPTTESFINFVEMLRDIPPVATGITRSIHFYRQSIQQINVGNIYLPHHYMGTLSMFPDIKTLQLERCYVLGADINIRPRQLITAMINNEYSSSPIFSRVTHLWINVSHPPTNFVYPRTLICLAMPLRLAVWYGLYRGIQDPSIVPNLKLLVVNLLPKKHALTTRPDSRHEMTPLEVWDSDVLQEQRDERIVIRQWNEDLWMSGVPEESIWKRALREGVRHPVFHNSPPIEIPDP